MAAPKPSYINHLNNFIKASQKDTRLTANHISLYLALFSTWNQHFFGNPFEIVREKILKICHIGSFNTYSKCLKDLHDFGYIIYSKAKLKGRRSSISIRDITVLNDTRTSTDIEFSRSKTDTTADANLRSNTDNTKSINKERDDTPTSDKMEKPESLSHVVTLFHLLGQPETEAAKFFHHYEANGWRQGGKIPITNWPAAARKWILNINPTKTHRNGKRAKPGNLDSNQDKSYSDPF